jgi:hypothetical protein
MTPLNPDALNTDRLEEVELRPYEPPVVSDLGDAAEITNAAVNAGPDGGIYS